MLFEEKLCDKPIKSFRVECINATLCFTKVISSFTPMFLYKNTLLCVVFQAPDLNPGRNPLPHQHNPLFAAADAASGSPMAPIVHPATSDEPSDNHQVKFPPIGFSCTIKTNTGLPQMNCEGLGSPQTQQEEATLTTTMSINTELDNASCLSILEPPANPLCRISLHPTEPPPGTSDFTPVPAEIPCAQFQTMTYMKPNNPTPVSTMVPPKHIPGELEEDFLRRKREYWRIKKKEQRAKKAIQDKGITLNRASTDTPSQDIQTQVRLNN